MRSQLNPPGLLEARWLHPMRSHSSHLVPGCWSRVEQLQPMRSQLSTWSWRPGGCIQWGAQAAAWSFSYSTVQYDVKTWRRDREEGKGRKGRRDFFKIGKGIHFEARLVFTWISKSVLKNSKFQEPTWVRVGGSRPIWSKVNILKKIIIEHFPKTIFYCFQFFSTINTNKLITIFNHNLKLF